MENSLALTISHPGTEFHVHWYYDELCDFKEKKKNAMDKSYSFGQNVVHSLAYNLVLMCCAVKPLKSQNNESKN